MLLDEPLSALDAALRLELRDELAALLRQFGTTVIFVTHDQDEALAIADRVAVMEGGKIRQIGTPEELYRNPQSAFVAEFVGHAMPLSGEIRQQTLCLEGGELPLPDHAGTGSVYVRAEDLRADPTGPLVAKVETVTFLGTHTDWASPASRGSACLHCIMKPLRLLLAIIYACPSRPMR